MKKYFTFDTTNHMKSINNMVKFFENMPLTLLADANLLGMLITVCSYRNVKQADLIIECLKLLGYKIRIFFDDGNIDITLINDGVYMHIYNNEVTQW